MMRKAIMVSLSFLLTVMPFTIDAEKKRLMQKNKSLKSSSTLSTCPLPIPTLNPEKWIELWK